MFADDTKVWCRIKTQKGGITLQEDLDKLSSWSDSWQLKFNAEKCKVMYIGHSYRTDCYMTGYAYQERQSWNQCRKREPLCLERPRDEANQGKIKTRHQEVFLQSTCGQRLESSPGDICECRVCQRLQERLYDRNYVRDMDDRSRWACQSINQQVTSNHLY